MMYKECVLRARYAGPQSLLYTQAAFFYVTYTHTHTKWNASRRRGVPCKKGEEKNERETCAQEPRSEGGERTKERERRADGQTRTRKKIAAAAAAKRLFVRRGVFTVYADVLCPPSGK